MMANIQADRRSEGRAGSRRIFPPQFKLQVLEAYRRDAQCRGNQRATARKFGIHRRQIQKWLQAESALRAALLRRAPQPAPSPPPYLAGSPESARLPSPSPPAPGCISTSLLHVQTSTSMHSTTPLLHRTTAHTPTAVRMSPTTHCSAMLPTMHCQPAAQSPTILYAAPAGPNASLVQASLQAFIPVEPIDLSLKRVIPEPEPARKPFKLFRPYLTDDEEPRKSAFAPVSTGCGMSAVLASQWAAGACPAGAGGPRGARRAPLR